MKNRRVLITGIPSYKLFYAEHYRDFGIDYGRRQDIRTLEDIHKSAELCGNTGNLLIGEGAVGAFEGQDCTYLPFWYLLSVLGQPERVEALRDRFDFVVLATANLLRREYSAHAEAEVIEKIGLPTLIMGVGLQVQSELTDLPEGTLRLLRHMADKGHHAFTRGVTTRDFMISRGVKNAVATGCPSVYLRPKEMVTSLRTLKDIDFRYLQSVMLGGYLGHREETAQDVRMLKGISNHVPYVLQDEFLHYGFRFEGEASGRRTYDSQSGEVKLDYAQQYNWESEATKLDPEATPSSVHVFFDNDDWRQWATSHDLFFGRRFHGGIAAMQAGVPALFITIDDRMRELVSYSGLPHIDTAVFDVGDKISALRSFIDQYDPEVSISVYKKREFEFRASLSQLMRN